MICTKCGSDMPAEAQFCASCGTPVIRVPGAEPIRWDPEAAEAAYHRRKPLATPGGSESLRYAGFWLRAVAYVIDLGLIGILATPVLSIIGPMAGTRWTDYSRLPRQEIFNMQNPAVLGFMAVALPIAFFCGWLYYALFESSSWQATPGKKLFGLRVCDLQGRPISFWRATARFLGRIVTGLVPFGIGYAIAGFTARKQAVHDFIAACLVLRVD